MFETLGLTFDQFWIVMLVLMLPFHLLIWPILIGLPRSKSFARGGEVALVRGDPRRGAGRAAVPGHGRVLVDAGGADRTGGDFRLTAPSRSGSPMLPDDVRTEIATLVRTGAHDRERLVEVFTEEMYEPGELDEAAVAAEIDAEFAAHAEEQKAYPETTDCDRLDAAFAALNARGVVVVQDAGFDQSDGYHAVQEAFAARKDQDAAVGYCFYHSQDLEGALRGRGLHFAFGPVDPAEERTVGVQVGEAVREELEAAGLTVEWDGTFNTRIRLPDLKWQRRTGPS